jgi:S1-C subfamily serine protease
MSLLRFIVLTLLSISTASAGDVASTSSIESMLLGNHAQGNPSKAAKANEKVANELEEFKVLAPDDVQLVQPPQGIVTVKPHELPHSTTGAQIYSTFARSVVLVITKEGLGSGVLINRTGDILTNWHVVRKQPEVIVVVKPLKEGSELQEGDGIRARVVKVDDVADLALLRPDKVPTLFRPLVLGYTKDARVGADVHAIGHPKAGGGWTYTKGVVSQIRQGFTWQTHGEQRQFKADVIQTQTPINPGNSGGPLINDEGILIGINVLKGQGEGLNFAVAADEIRRFLATPGSRITEGAKAAKAKSECKIKILYDGPNAEKTMTKRGIDADCDGKADIEIRTPYDPKKPIIVVVDNNKDGRIDQVIFDTDRDGKWDFSLKDTDFDGKWDLIGFHPDGELKATRYEPYKE